MSRPAHTNGIACCFRLLSGSASDVLHLCPRCPPKKVDPQTLTVARLTPSLPLSLFILIHKGDLQNESGQTSVCIVAGGYAEWQGFGYFVGCEGPLENFYWVSMVMRVKEHNTFLHKSVCSHACVCVGGGGGGGVLSKGTETQVLVSSRTLFLCFLFCCCCFAALC